MKITAIDSVKVRHFRTGVSSDAISSAKNSVGLNAGAYNLDFKGLQALSLQNASMINFKGDAALPEVIPTLGRKASSPMERMLFESVHSKTPDYVIQNPLLDLDNKGEIVFNLKKEHLNDYDAQNNPEGLGLRKWFANYEKEAKVSTAGIRGPQNILYPWDTRFPINQIGVLLATTAKAMAANEKYPNQDLHKIAAGEVRYNTDKYIDIIARAQAANGITTHVPDGRTTIPIWLASFLAFKEDMLGGEYVTSSHGISVKTATKDINDQGSQYLPEESMEFVDKIKYIFEQTEKNGSYQIKLAAKDHPLIKESGMKTLNNGVGLYVDYLRDGVASDANLNLIRSAQNPIYIENVGGSAYRTLSQVLDNEKMGIGGKFKWFNTEEDPFYHGAGKADVDSKGKPGFYDYSVDASLLVRNKDGEVLMPVAQTLGYDKKLADSPIGTVILITDPDHDRLSLAQIEGKDRIPELKKLGIDYMPLGGEDSDRVLTMYTPNQSFLLTMDFHMKQLKAAGKWDDHPRFMIKTTASAMSWDEWGENNGVKVINTPVGFKELANIMKKVEKQMSEAPDKEVIIKDVYGKDVNLGVQPRLIFAGEESGGMIVGPEELIKSKSGREAIAMREKSATEAIIISSALVAELEAKGITMSEHLQKVFEDNKIKGKYDIREDIAYYNESEPDINKLNADKKAGEELRTKNDMFYLEIAMAKRTGKISLEQAKEILQSTFADLDFSDLKDIKFVGDGTYLEFPTKYIEIRPSGTDAKTKAYGAGSDKDECIRFAKAMGNHSGDRNSTYRKYLPDIKDQAMQEYTNWAMEGTPKGGFVPPNYSKTAPELVKN